MAWALIVLATFSLSSVEVPEQAPEPAPVVRYQRAETPDEAYSILAECWGSDDWRECPAVKARKL